MAALLEKKPPASATALPKYGELRLPTGGASLTVLKMFRAEMLNVLNRHHFADPNTSLGNTSNFGDITGMTGSPRNMQLGLRLGW